MNKIKHAWENNLLGWQLAVLDNGFRYIKMITNNNTWEAFDKNGLLKGVWGPLSWKVNYGWIDTQ